MVNSEGIEGELLHREMLSLVQRLVGKSVDDALHSADTLHGLAEVLNGFAELQRTADAATLRGCATGVQAVTVQALLTACQMMAISERLTTCALVLEKLGAPHGS